MNLLPRTSEIDSRLSAIDREIGRLQDEMRGHLERLKRLKRLIKPGRGLCALQPDPDAAMERAAANFQLRDEDPS